MGNCIRCGNKTLRSDYLYCKKCYNDIVTECDECNEAIFDDDFFEIIIDEEVFHLCEKCFNNVLEHNDLNILSNNINYRFFEKINLAALEVNDYIIHKKFGFGKIIKIDDIIISIDFFDKNRVFDKQYLNNLSDVVYAYDGKIFNEKFLINKYEVFNEKKKLTREKYDSNHRAADGHMLKSRGEHLIDDFLFNSNIRHIYEKVVIDPINDNECTCDWYLPDCDLYIEFWGVENSKRYEDTREYKSIIYKNANLNLLEIEADDVDVRLDYIIEKIKLLINK